MMDQSFAVRENGENKKPTEVGEDNSRKGMTTEIKYGGNKGVF